MLTTETLITATHHGGYPQDVLDDVKNLFEAGIETEFASDQDRAEYVLGLDLDPNGYDTDPDMLAQGHVPATEERNDQVRLATFRELRALAQ